MSFRQFRHNWLMKSLNLLLRFELSLIFFVRIFRFGDWLPPPSHGKTIPRYSGTPAWTCGITPTGLSPFIVQHSRRFGYRDWETDRKSVV